MRFSLALMPPKSESEPRRRKAATRTTDVSMPIAGPFPPVLRLWRRLARFRSGDLLGWAASAGEERMRDTPRIAETKSGSPQPPFRICKLMSLDHAPLSKGRHYGNDRNGTYAGASAGAVGFGN